MNNKIHLFKYMKADNLKPEQYDDFRKLLRDDHIRYYEADDPMRNWVIAKQILSDRVLYLSRYTYLNDPFECIVNIDYSNGVSESVLESYYSAVLPHLKNMSEEKLLSLEQIKMQAQQYKKEGKKHFYHPPLLNKDNSLPFGVYSFSDQPDDIQMWSYYGGNHSGICIVFEVDFQKIISQLRLLYPRDTPEKLFEILNTKGCRFDYIDANGASVRFGLQKVDYKDCVIDYPAEDFYKAHFDEVLQEDLSWILTGAKYIKWQHENEWRLVCFDRYSDSADDLLPISVFDFIKPCGIILGVSMTVDLKNILKEQYGNTYKIIELTPNIGKQSLTIDYSLSPNKSDLLSLLTE